MNGRKRILQAIAGGALGALALFGGTAAAGDYPPNDPTVTTVASSSAGGTSDPADPATDPATDPAADPAAQGLAATGSSNDTTLKLAGAAVVAGAGMLVASRRRHRSATT